MSPETGTSTATTASLMQSPSSVGSTAGHNAGTVRWNLPHQPSESGFGLGPVNGAGGGNGVV